MISTRTILFISTALSLFISRAAWAQDRLEAIMKKPTLSAPDRATLKAEVSQRVKRLFDATPDKLADARERVLRTARIKDVSKAALDAYAQECAAELENVAASGSSDSALTGVLLLVDLDHPKTSDALAAALRNSQAGVRYTAARGIIALQGRLKNDEEACTRVLAELGKAGANERDELVLRKIYLALGFKSAATDFKFDDALASGLNELLEGRIKMLASGSRDELRDEPAADLGKACYAGASGEQRARLIGNMTSLLANAVDRYFNEETAPEALPRLRRLIGKLEASIHGMMADSKVSPPADTVGEALEGSAGDRPKQLPKAQKAIESIRELLRREPLKPKP